MAELFRGVTQFFANKPGAHTAFSVIDELKYSKEWDTSGASIVLREKWFDANKKLVREVVHDYAKDMAAAEAQAQGDTQ